MHDAAGRRAVSHVMGYTADRRAASCHTPRVCTGRRATHVLPVRMRGVVNASIVDFRAQFEQGVVVAIHAEEQRRRELISVRDVRGEGLGLLSRAAATTHTLNPMTAHGLPRQQQGDTQLRENDCLQPTHPGWSRRVPDFWLEPHNRHALNC